MSHNGRRHHFYTAVSPAALYEVDGHRQAERRGISVAASDKFDG